MTCIWLACIRDKECGWYASGNCGHMKTSEIRTVFVTRWLIDCNVYCLFSLGWSVVDYYSLLYLWLHRTEPCSDLAWVCLICAFCWLWYCEGEGQNLVWNWLDFAWFDAWFEVKTSCEIDYSLLDFCYWKGWSCLEWLVWGGQNLITTWLDFAWFLLLRCLEVMGVARKRLCLEIGWFLLFCGSGIAWFWLCIAFVVSH